MREYIKELWYEFEPVFRHSVIVSLMITILGGLYVLAKHLPSEYSEILQSVDKPIIATILAVYGISVIITLVRRSLVDSANEDKKRRTHLRNEIIDLEKRKKEMEAMLSRLTMESESLLPTASVTGSDIAGKPPVLSATPTTTSEHTSNLAIEGAGHE